MNQIPSKSKSKLESQAGVVLNLYTEGRKFKSVEKIGQDSEKKSKSKKSKKISML